MQLNIRAFALTCGLMWGFGLLLITWWILLLDGSTCAVTFIGKVYRGFNLSFSGSLIGFVWALVDGVIGGAIFAWLYNLIAKRLVQK